MSYKNDSDTNTTTSFSIGATKERRTQRDQADPLLAIDFDAAARRKNKARRTVSRIDGNMQSPSISGRRDMDRETLLYHITNTKKKQHLSSLYQFLPLYRSHLRTGQHRPYYCSKTMCHNTLSCLIFFSFSSLSSPFDSAMSSDVAVIHKNTSSVPLRAEMLKRCAWMPLWKVETHCVPKILLKLSGIIAEPHCNQTLLHRGSTLECLFHGKWLPATK